jgi:uridine kinase
VTVITSEIDSSLDANLIVVPGVGEFGNRYFCDA